MAGGATDNGAVTFPKNATEEVRVQVQDYKGRQLVNARVYYLDADADEWKPTKKGLALSPELAAQVGVAIQAAADRALGVEA